MYYLFFKKGYSDSGLRLVYSEEELDFLEGEFARNKFPNEEMRKEFARHLAVDVLTCSVSRGFTAPFTFCLDIVLQQEKQIL